MSFKKYQKYIDINTIHSTIGTVWIGWLLMEIMFCCICLYCLCVLVLVLVHHGCMSHWYVINHTKLIEMCVHIYLKSRWLDDWMGCFQVNIVVPRLHHIQPCIIYIFVIYSSRFLSILSFHTDCEILLQSHFCKLISVSQKQANYVNSPSSHLPQCVPVASVECCTE